MGSMAQTYTHTQTGEAIFIARYNRNSRFIYESSRGTAEIHGVHSNVVLTVSTVRCNTSQHVVLRRKS